MWNQALRRVVQAEERLQEDRRRQQLAQAASAGSCVPVDPSPSAPFNVQASVAAQDATPRVPGDACLALTDDTKPRETSMAVVHSADEPQEKEDDRSQQNHLLSWPTSAWACLEDTQQATCLALNASETLLAVGERDGRVTIWDNTTIRVITRELDPTLIALPPLESSPPARASGTATKGARQEQAREKEDRAVQDKDDRKEEAVVGVEQEEEERDERKTEADKNKEERGAGSLTLGDLRVVQSALKVVSQCAWSCDSRYLYAACDERASTRRARLCVWDVHAATLVAAYPFDGTILALSAHPQEPNLLVVSYANARPVLVDLASGECTSLEAIPLENADVPPPTSQHTSRHAVLASCARYGRSGRRIYCATSRSTVAVLDGATLQCLDSLTLTVSIQFVDLCVNGQETALLVTSAKGIHELAVTSPEPRAAPASTIPCTDAHPLGLCEVALHSTGAVRAPWAVCCFSGDEAFVVGTPVVRHRHVGENGLFTWHRASFRGKATAQHNVGVKDGVLALAWDRARESVLAVSTSGSLYVLEEHFTSTWPGAMYPEGFRLITDNEKYLQVFDDDEDERKREKARRTRAAQQTVVDVFTVRPPSTEVPAETASSRDLLAPRWYIPAIPIAHYHRRPQQLQTEAFRADKDFGLGQSVFEPLQSVFQHKTSSARPGGRSTSRKHPKRRRR